MSHWRQMFIVVTYIFFQNSSYWNWLKLPSQNTAFVHSGVFWSLTCVCQRADVAVYTWIYFLFIDRMDGVSLTVLRLKATAELHQGLLLNFLKKIHVLEGRRGMLDGEEGWKWGKRNRKKKKKSWKKTWHFCLRWSMLWCHTWNVSEVSVINTSLSEIFIF